MLHQSIASYRVFVLNYLWLQPLSICFRHCCPPSDEQWLCSGLNNLLDKNISGTLVPTTSIASKKKGKKKVREESWKKRTDRKEGTGKKQEGEEREDKGRKWQEGGKRERERKAKESKRITAGGSTAVACVTTCSHTHNHCVMFLDGLQPIRESFRLRSWTAWKT